MTGSPITVLCVDDHNLVRECVVAIIERERGFRVAAEARTVKDAMACFVEAAPDVTLVSLQSRGLDCLQTVRAIRRMDPRARIIVYARDETEAVYLALDAGAAGFVLKDAVSADLIRVITRVHNRDGMLVRDIRSKLEARGGLPSLTAREVEILELLNQGLRTKAIAATLRISDHTVKVHLKNVYEKLGVRGQAAALADALRRGFVRLATGRHVASVRHRSKNARNRASRGAPATSAPIPRNAAMQPRGAVVAPRPMQPLRAPGSL
jgi:DNA-binding NarL/FixJ family response regulator